MSCDIYYVLFYLNVNQFLYLFSPGTKKAESFHNLLSCMLRMTESKLLHFNYLAPLIIDTLANPFIAASTTDSGVTSMSLSINHFSAKDRSMS